ncbi:hypothetical protein JHK87_022339 [Glycine soja]|nr:hypothetical protein JHK87_022339 [Glycine soja]
MGILTKKSKFWTAVNLSVMVYSIQDGAMIPGVSSRMSHLMDYAGRKIAHNEILKDIVIEKDYPEIIVSECAHLLDFLYAMIVPKLEEQSDLVQLEDQHRDKEDNEKSIVNYAKQFLSEVWRVLSKLATALISLIMKVLQCRALKVIIWFPGIGIIKQPVEYLFFSQDKEATKAEDGNLSSDNVINKPPLMEEIVIPSVKEL